MNTFLTVGTNEIKRDLFKPIKDSLDMGSIKPSGGLWLSEFDLNHPNFNSWVENLLIKPYILFYKNNGYSPFLQPCSVVKLDNKAHIFVLDNCDKYRFLENNFPNSNGFSFSSLSRCFDGIFIDMRKLQFYLENSIKNKFNKFDINTLILFNCDAIEFYYSGVVDIDNFDFEYMPCDKIDYIIKWNNEKKYVRSKKKEDLLRRKI